MRRSLWGALLGQNYVACAAWYIDDIDPMESQELSGVLLRSEG